ncbi:Uncharacterised protein [Nocardia brasiliensis]|nr:Uncharacterised protein [Nocardia brasiliensis]
MLAFVAVPSNPLEGLLRQLAFMMCTLSAGVNCGVIQ